VISENEFKTFKYNVLGANSLLTGDLKLSGDTIINSRIEGNLEVQDYGKLVLERGSFIKGTIKAIDLEIFGEFEGEILCSGLVSIRSSAVVTGTIKASRLVIYPGAIVESQTNSESI